MATPVDTLLTRAANREMTLIELLSAAEALAATGETARLIALYDTWITNNEEHPLLYVACFNYSVVLSGPDNAQAARTALEQAIRLNPEFIPPYINLGLAYERLGLPAQAVATWSTVVTKLVAVTPDTIAYKAGALKEIGRLRETLLELAGSEDVLQQSIELLGSQRDVVQYWVVLRQRQCKWPITQALRGVSVDSQVRGLAPLSLAACSDDAMLQLANAAAYNRHDVGWPASTFTAGPWATPDTRRRDVLRIGYLSSDLREHSIGFLMAEVFEEHDRSAVEVLAYYCGPHLPDAVQARIKTGVDRWVDIAALTDRQAACRLLDDRVDILVDINGYTRFSRTPLLAMRPAPIIVNWLGYPGTMGSPYHDYIIADDYIIPKAYEMFYSERVLRLPCYQPNDRKRVISAHSPSRAEVGLPEDAVVYGSFNGLHKITPSLFRLWMAILEKVPNAVLWLLADVAEVDQRLRQRAADNGIAPERLIFAPRLKNAEHMARYPVVDVILDTWPYGAHTTASDALWMGVPIVTLSGRSFASRVCGSLARSAGLLHLVCTTPDQYIDRAVELGRNQTMLQWCKELVKLNRDTCALFDTPRLVSRLEVLYRQMWEEYQTGTIPRPDLSNLDVYHDIGVELYDSDVGLLSDSEYRDQYRRRLAYRHSFSPIPYDRRLWSRER